jgi:flavin reductase (DIM6/NTAB) family NADH-FMN oxidoreductase RutF
MNKIRLDNNAFIPMLVTVVGCMLKGKPNFMAVGWVTRVNANPPHIGVGISRTHATPEGIIENGTFSVCFPKSADAARVDYCGLVSANTADKSSLFTPFYGELKTAPMIEEASLSLECALVETVNGPTNFFFIGEIKGAYAQTECVSNGKLDPQKTDCLFLTMPDNTYWSLGSAVGKAWHMGKELINK